MYSKQNSIMPSHLVKLLGRPGHSNGNNDNYDTHNDCGYCPLLPLRKWSLLAM